MIKFFKNRRGFTVVELIIAMGLFVILLGIVSGSFINALRTQGRIVALVAANDNANSSLEQMAREIRTASQFDLRNQGADLYFVNYKDEEITYRLVEGSIQRAVEVDGVEVSNKKITADNVAVKMLNFKLCDPGNCKTPRITVALGVSPSAASIKDIMLNLQTSVSARFE